MQLTESEHPVGERPRFDSWQRDTNGTEQEKQLVKDFGPWSLKQQSRRLSNIWKRYKKNPSVHSWSEAEKSWFDDSRNNEERKVFFTKEKKFPRFPEVVEHLDFLKCVYVRVCVCVCVFVRPLCRWGRRQIHAISISRSIPTYFRASAWLYLWQRHYAFTFIFQKKLFLK